MAGRRKKRQYKEIDGVMCCGAETMAASLTPKMNPQYLKKLAREHKIPGHLEGIQWFFDPKRVTEALNERVTSYRSNVVSSKSAHNKISKKDLLNDPLAGF